MDPKFQPPALRVNQGSDRGKDSLPDVADHVELPAEYRIEKSGAVMEHIVNAQGKVVSGDYMGFESFKQGGIYAIVGRTGSMAHLLRVPQDQDGFFQESPIEFHFIKFDNEIGQFTCNIGASRWIFDPQTGGKIHEEPYMYFEQRDGKIYGCWPGKPPVEIVTSRPGNQLESPTLAIEEK